MERKISRRRTGLVPEPATPGRRLLASWPARWTPTVPAIRACWRRVPWRMLLMSLGLVIQAGLMVLMWQLIELIIDLFEVWALLARHSLGL